MDPARSAGRRAWVLAVLLALACGGGSTRPGDVSPADRGPGDLATEAAGDPGLADGGRDPRPDPAADGEVPDDGRDGAGPRDPGRDGEGGGDAPALDGVGEADADVPPPCQPEGTACNDGDKCTVDDACRDGECRGTPVTCADDGLPCTAEACSFGSCTRVLLAGYCRIDGTCWTDGQPNPRDPCQRCRTGNSTDLWTGIDDVPCDDGDPCTGDDRCDAGTCRGVPALCPDDGLACTADACRAGDCVHEVLTGACLVDGLCADAGAPAPGDPCHGCDPAHPRVWTLRPGAACDDGDPCTESDACGADGRCHGDAIYCPDDGIACTRESCRGGLCVHDPPARSCTIEGQCWADGQARPGSPCEACDPDADPAGWTVSLGGPCDDGDACTASDTCDGAGACAGVEVTCPGDALPCTADRCRDGACRHDPVAGFCVLDGACWSQGQAKPGDPCRICNAAGDPRSWAAVAGIPCDDGDACTVNDQCGTDGGCSGQVLGCPADDLPCTADGCMAGACVHPVAPGYCVVEGACWTDGQADPANPCRSCDAAADPRGWTVRGGAACNDGDACTVNDRCGADGSCAGLTVTCPADSLPCTVDRCVDGACRNEVTAGFCVADGACWTDGQARPGDPCHACDGAANPRGWTVKAGAACNDGDACTLGDACGGDGACAGTAIECPPDRLPCILAHCVDGACRGDVLAGSCVAEGACWTDGQARPGDPCRGCDAGADDRGWTVRSGASCSDGDPCTTGDACDADGACAGRAIQCPDDGLACTTAACVDGTCATTVAPRTCAIDGACRGNGDADPANGCRFCDPSSSQTAWTGVTGMPCEDGDPCTTPDQCTAGLCVPGPDTCPPPVCTTHAQCIPSGKVCGPWKTAAENRCSTPCKGVADCADGEICSRLPGSANVGYCQPMPHPAGTPDFGPCSDGGESCQPDVCTDTFCTPHCGGGEDCPADGTCLPAGDLVNGMQGVCEPTAALAALKPYGAQCTNDGMVYDSSQCQSGHCDLSAWYFDEYGGANYQVRCTNLCTTDADCHGWYGDECNLVLHSSQPMADAIPLDTGVAPTFDGVLGCYTRRYASGANRAVGQACSQPRDCATNKCFGFAGVAGQYCTTFCGGDADCPSPMVCDLASVNLVSWWLAMDSNELQGAYTLVRICVMKP